jgi:hypothetical protein
VTLAHDAVPALCCVDGVEGQSASLIRRGLRFKSASTRLGPGRLDQAVWLGVQKPSFLRRRPECECPYSRARVTWMNAITLPRWEAGADACSLLAITTGAEIMDQLFRCPVSRDVLCVSHDLGGLASGLRRRCPGTAVDGRRCLICACQSGQLGTVAADNLKRDNRLHLHLNNNTM